MNVFIRLSKLLPSLEAGIFKDLAISKNSITFEKNLTNHLGQRKKFIQWPDDDRIVSHDAVLYVLDATSKLSVISS